MHKCTKRGRFAVVSCIYASYLISFFMSLAYITKPLSLKVGDCGDFVFLRLREFPVYEFSFLKWVSERLTFDRELDDVD